MDKKQVMAMKELPIDDNLNLSSSGSSMNYLQTTGTHNTGLSSSTSIGSFTTSDFAKSLSCYHYWQDYYYPTIIRESYPMYIQERAKDKGKQAFEIIKILKDKRFVSLEKVGDFIDLMDELIKIL